MEYLLVLQTIQVRRLLEESLHNEVDQHLLVFLREQLQVPTGLLDGLGTSLVPALVVQQNARQESSLSRETVPHPPIQLLLFVLGGHRPAPGQVREDLPDESDVPSHFLADPLERRGRSMFNQVPGQEGGLRRV